ncbi:ACP S-malonyltransferase [Amphiplicatus metriothermophilus]|uniref:Malonyl CoA-acyl carrier protein transacylase n=1 Tax=Amphiplicatus metriothermophilus TaxID=1519374 RepID=A0A239PY43_9PROT|nr:ACP S-malonyltransferase [Amphiplicatus metriothermophilus]MBB5519859.1 [acyl-carrier-protein] S-malonyltransferase [Amphiplicatus metriothermophilus]SNT75090.1 [Acyl-carrier-protein] S-malonyltransferase [Amphiplicatus metriothermophilus]
MARAFVFPGQGSQSVGMGRALAEAFPAAREVFEEVDEALKQKLSKLMWEGPMEELTLTANAQPALMAHSIAMLRVLEKEAGVEIENAMFVAGHSLGEYSALCAAGALGLAETARLLRIRGEAMQAAVPAGEGAMAALIGVDLETAQKAIDAAPGAGVCEIANDNAPGQAVISGEKARVEAVCAGAKAFGAKLAKLLPVSAPFHSSLMAPAAEAMEKALAEAEIRAPKVPLVANVTAQETVSPEEIRDLLVRQVTGRVRWTESVAYMAEKGCEKFVEIGAGKVLAGLIKRIARDAAVVSVGEPADIDAFVKF